jgi:DNA-binding NarL/FixJ family response regulator
MTPSGTRHGAADPASAYDPPLSPPREREIAILAAAGLTNQQIGERLFLSHRTVGTHLYRIYPKLGVPSRAALRDALAFPPPNGEVADRLGKPNGNSPHP